MKLDELTLTEQAVLSSWIDDLTLDKNGVIMTLGNGRQYRVARVSPTTYRAWVSAPSKGKFWHRRIKLNYITTRI